MKPGSFHNLTVHYLLRNVKKNGRLFQIFVAFSKYTNFTLFWGDFRKVGGSFLDTPFIKELDSYAMDANLPIHEVRAVFKVAQN